MILAYLCPALLDWLIFFAFFAVFYRAGELQLPASKTVMLAVLFQVTYLLSCLPIGKILNRRTARSLLIIGAIGSTTTGTLALLAYSFPFMLTTLMVMGVFGSLFFNAFQTYMRGETPPGGLSRSVASYTFAWSLGAASGQLVSGVLYQLGPMVLVPASFVVGCIILAPLLLRKTKPINTASAEEHIEQGSTRARPVNPAYVMVGWLMIFTIMFVQRPIQTFVPATSAASGITPAAAGLLLFLHMLLQALFGFAMIHWRDWLYRRTPLILIQGGAAALLCVLAFTHSYLVLLVGLSVLGIYAGFAYFCAVYYAGNTGNRSRNVSINELLVGVGSIAGLLSCEAWLRFFNNPRGIYLVSAAALIISVAAQTFVVSKTRFRVVAAKRPDPIKTTH